jgi:hypothetical protein
MNPKCENCQREIPEYASFCPFCGKKIERINEPFSSATPFFRTIFQVSTHWQFIPLSIQLTINLLCFFAILYLLSAILALVSMDGFLFIYSMIFLLLSSVSSYYLFKMDRKGVFFGFVFSVISLLIYLPVILSDIDDLQVLAFYSAFIVFFLVILVLLFFGRRSMKSE